MPVWDCCFLMKGMTISGIPFPCERIEIDNDLVLKGVEEKEECIAHIKLETEEGELVSTSKGYEAAVDRIMDFVSVYALKSFLAPSFQSAGATTMKSSDRLGDANALTLKMRVEYPEEKLKEYTQREYVRINKAVVFFKANEKVIKENPWLRNALRYFYFAITGNRLEDKLINMMIALEALFLGKEERGELRYRLSLRTATLIGNTSDDQTTKQVFEDIKNLYDKRSDIVHGAVTEIATEDINKLEMYTRQAIEMFIKMSQTMSKENILQLLDDCLVEKESIDKLKASVR